MIANVSPCSSSADHTLNTLRYSYRIKEKRINNSEKSNNKISNNLELNDMDGIFKF